MKKKTLEDMKPGEIFYITQNGVKFSCIKIEKLELDYNCVMMKHGRLMNLPQNIPFNMLVEF